MMQTTYLWSICCQYYVYVHFSWMSCSISYNRLYSETFCSSFNNSLYPLNTSEATAHGKAPYRTELTHTHTHYYQLLTFRWLCIMINSYNKTNKMHEFLKSIFGIKLYMFRTVPLSIIRNFSLYTQQWYMSYRFADGLWAGSGRTVQNI